MKSLRYSWRAGGNEHTLELQYVAGTCGQPFLFGSGKETKLIDLQGFFIATTPVTQALWMHLMGNNPACAHGDRKPLENVSWDMLAAPDGFFARANAGPLCALLQTQAATTLGALRLPSETEWEYAARGGPHWGDGYRFSGSDDVDAVGWYQNNSGDRTHEVAEKAPNQRGLFDMCGNIWEWCEDAHSADIGRIPADGTSLVDSNDERVLRGGCYHNWAIHRTVFKRYEIVRAAHDGCIGFRPVLPVMRSRAG